jgi:hypothetical protein
MDTCIASKAKIASLMKLGINPLLHNTLSNKNYQKNYSISVFILLMHFKNVIDCEAVLFVNLPAPVPWSSNPSHITEMYLQWSTYI